MYACLLKPMPVAKQMCDIIQRGMRDGAIKDEAGLKNILGRILSEYILIQSDSTGSFVVHYRQSDSKIGKIINACAPLLKGITFPVANALLAALDMESSIKKKKKNDVSVDSVVSIADFFRHGHLGSLAYPDLFVNSVYIPHGVGVSIPERVISSWEYGRYYLPRIERSGHGAPFCEYKFYVEVFASQLLYYGLNIDKLPYDYLSRMDARMAGLPLLLDLVFQVSGCGPQTFVYVMRWLAFVMYSGQKAQTALFFVSPEQGVGKSTFALMARQLLLPNAMNVNFRQLVGSRFTGDQQSKQLIVCDEVCEEGGKSSTSALDQLKNIVTNQELAIEKKFENVTDAQPNYHSFVFTSNNVPRFITCDRADRRFVLIRSCGKILQPRKTENFTEINSIINAERDDDEDEEFVTPRHSNDTAAFKRYPCCSERRRNKTKGAGMALLSFLLSVIQQKNTVERWTPFNSTIITDYHIEMQNESDPMLSLLWNFVKVETNCGGMSSGDYKCAYKDCTLSPEEHFDQEYPHWQVCCVLLNTTEDTEKLFAEKHDAFGIKGGVTIVRGQFFKRMYNFPNFLDMKEKLNNLVNVQNRIRV